MGMPHTSQVPYVPSSRRRNDALDSRQLGADLLQPPGIVGWGWAGGLLRGCGWLGARGSAAHHLILWASQAPSPNSISDTECTQSASDSVAGVLLWQHDSARTLRRWPCGRRTTMLNDRQLAVVLSAFARTMLTDFPIQAILDLLVEQIVELMPITGAGVTMICPGVGTRYVAASNDTVLRFEQLQSEVGEGPCVVACQSGRTIAIADLRREERFPSFSRRAVEAGLAAVFAFPLNHPDGAIGALDLYRDTPGELDDYSIVAAQTLADVATAYLVNAQGRAAMQLATERSRETSLHDPLTGLANRTLLLERLEHASARGRRTGLTSAVLFLDLDRFKTVNDTFGHQIGDEALVVVGERLSEVLRAGDTLARVSGDEFVILCEDLADAAQVGVVAQRVDAALFPPLVLSELELDVSASVGIAFAGSRRTIPVPNRSR